MKQPLDSIPERFVMGRAESVESDYSHGTCEGFEARGIGQAPPMNLGIKAVDDGDIMPAPGEPDRGAGADKPGAAGDNYFHYYFMPLEGALAERQSPPANHIHPEQVRRGLPPFLPRIACPPASS